MQFIMIPNLPVEFLKQGRNDRRKSLAIYLVNSPSRYTLYIPVTNSENSHYLPVLHHIIFMMINNTEKK